MSPEQQKAVLYHEARHALEPLVSQQEPHKYAMQRINLSNLTLNYTTRKHEFVADEHATKMGYGEEFISALANLQEGIKESILPAKKVIDISKAEAVKNGFRADDKKIHNTAEYQKVVDNSKLLQLPLAATLAAKAAASSINMTFSANEPGKFIKTLEKLVSTHPTDAAREANIRKSMPRER